MLGRLADTIVDLCFASHTNSRFAQYQVCPPADDQAFIRITFAIPKCQAIFNQLSGQTVKFLPVRRDVLFYCFLQFAQGLALGHVIQKIRGFAHGRRGLTQGWYEDPIFHVPIGLNQYHQRTVRCQADKFDVFDRGFVFWREHEAGALRKPRQC